MDLAAKARIVVIRPLVGRGVDRGRVRESPRLPTPRRTGLDTSVSIRKGSGLGQTDVAGSSVDRLVQQMHSSA